MSETYYKIKRSDGLYSTGGQYPKFSKTGKIWKTLAHLRSHLNNLDLRKLGDEWYRDCVIVELITSEKVLCEVQEEVEFVKQKKLEKNIAAKEREKEWKERVEREKLIELLEKYPEFKEVSTKGKFVKRGE